LYFNIFNVPENEKTRCFNKFCSYYYYFFQDVGMALFRRNKILTFYKAILLWYDEPKIAIENALILACMEIHRWPLPSTQKLV
jgi:hypothetical protein